jgi:REP-associated tyrosine transposase
VSERILFFPFRRNWRELAEVGSQFSTFAGFSERVRRGSARCVRQNERGAGFPGHLERENVTKYRHRVLDGDAINRLRAIFSKVCADFEAALVEMDSEDNHVHLLVNYPAKHSIATLLNSWKGVSSRMLRRERPDLRPRYRQGVLWSPSYFAASCAGAIGILKAHLPPTDKYQRLRLRGRSQLVRLMRV